MDLVPIHVKVLLTEEGYQRLVIEGYELHNLVDLYTQEDIDNFQTNEKIIKVIDEFEADELIIRSSLEFTADSWDKMVNGLGSLGFQVHSPNSYTYLNFILHDIPWFPSFSVKGLWVPSAYFDSTGLPREGPILAARCMPKLFYQTQALKIFSYLQSTFETTRDWICAGPYDSYVSFYLADFINGMQNIMGKTYKDFLEQEV